MSSVEVSYFKRQHALKNKVAHIMEIEMVTRLPVPEIREETFQHSFKQVHRRDDISRLKPPKLKPRYDSNCNRDHTAHAISFRSDDFDCVDDSSLLCSSYDCSLNDTLFEQCFVCLAKIGEGSFGEVFKVRSKEDGLLYAVKMSKQLFRSDLYRQERLEEVRRYEQFSGHANCLRFYRAWEQDDRLYIQMELCRESLESYLERKRTIPEEKIWSILLDLLLALKSLHDRNLLHLDIKLDNVLIGDDDSCKLADFGLVIDVNRANRHQATEGDSRYVAPEIMQGNFSKAADVFSLGIAMLELSCYLELPANGPLWQQLRCAILPQNFLNKISEDLQNVIKDMMTPDPKERPTVDQLLEHTRFAKIIQRRSQWKLMDTFKLTLRKFRRLTWSKLGNLKNIVFKFFANIITFLCIHGPRSDPSNDFPNELSSVGNKKPSNIGPHIVSSTPTIGSLKAKARIDLHFDECIELRKQQSSYHKMSDKFGDSSPVNHHHNGFRFRKDLTKTSFNESCNNSSLGRKSLAYSDDDDSDSQTSLRKSMNVSSLKGKKLFADMSNIQIQSV